MKDTDKCFEVTLDRRLLNEDIDVVESSDNSPEVNGTNIEFE